VKTTRPRANVSAMFENPFQKLLSSPFIVIRQPYTHRRPATMRR
jgi:hypothetical protein